LGELLELLFKSIFSMVQAVLEAVLEWLVYLARRAAYGDKGTRPIPRRLFWFRMVDLLLTVYLACFALGAWTNYPPPLHVWLFPEIAVVVAGFAFFFCFLVSLEGEDYLGNRPYVYLSVVAAVFVLAGAIALAASR
jgi:hypothetical protein